MPEPVLAPTTIPIVTPRVDLPGPVTPAQAPVQSASPQDANAAVPQYPGIPEPGQDLVSLQATVTRLKEIVEMMTGTRAGGSSTDVVGGHLLLQKSTANASARLEVINQVTVNENFAMAARTTILEAEFRNYTGEDPTGTTFNASLTEELQVYADADEALAFRSLNMESALQMTEGTTASARLTTIESTAVTQGNEITATATRASYLESELQMNPTTHVSAKLSSIDHTIVTVLPGSITAVSDRTTTLEATIYTPGTGVTARLTTVETATTTTLPGSITAVADRTSALETTINTPTTGVTARLSVVETATVTTLPGSINAQASRINDLVVELDFNETTKVSARLNTVESVAGHADASGARAEVKYGVYGLVGGAGSTLPGGYFEFGGLYNTDPATGASSIGYNMVFQVNTFILKDPTTSVPKTVFQYTAGKFTFTGDVEINGSLIVNGTVITDKIGTNAVSNNAATAYAVVNGDSVVAPAISVREGGRLLIVVMMTDATASLGSVSASGAFYPISTSAVYVNGVHLGNLTMTSALTTMNYLGGSSYAFSRALFPSSAQFLHGPLSVGSYTASIRNDTGFTCTFAVSVTELAR